MLYSFYTVDRYLMRANPFELVKPDHKADLYLNTCMLNHKVRKVKTIFWDFAQAQTKMNTKVKLAVHTKLLVWSHSLAYHSLPALVHQYQIGLREQLCARFSEGACYCAWHFSAFHHPLLFHTTTKLSQSIAGSEKWDREHQCSTGQCRERNSISAPEKSCWSILLQSWIMFLVSSLCSCKYWNLLFPLQRVCWK